MRPVRVSEHLEEGWAVVDGEGLMHAFAVGAHEDVEGALAWAEGTRDEEGPLRGRVSLDFRPSWLEEKRQAYAANAEDILTPQRALELCHLPKPDRTFTVANLLKKDPREAYQALLPLLEKTGAAEEYRSLGKLTTGFLTQNSKLLKSLTPADGIETADGKPIPPTLSKGVSLLPHEAARIGVPTTTDKALKRSLAVLGPESVRLMGGDPSLPMAKTVGLCAGSSKECRVLCLSTSGYNDRHTSRMAFRTRALYQQPEAFWRTLVGAVEYLLCESVAEDMACSFRFNIISDIPLELYFPDLFEHYAGQIRFYDYTKVPGRPVQDPNYHLTFSYSGANMIRCQREMDRGMNVAVAFLVPFKMMKERPSGGPVFDLKKMRFMGRRVIDGDKHDLRYHDPQGVVVGLTYKRAMNTFKTGHDAWWRFIIPTYVDREAGVFMAAETPGSTLTNPSNVIGYGEKRYMSDDPYGFGWKGGKP